MLPISVSIQEPHGLYLSKVPVQNISTLTKGGTVVEPVITL